MTTIHELKALFGVPKTTLRVCITNDNNGLKWTSEDRFDVDDDFLAKSPIYPTAAMDNEPSMLTSKSGLKRIIEFTIEPHGDIAIGFHCEHYNYEVNCGGIVRLWLLSSERTVLLPHHRGETLDYIGNDDFLIGFSRKISFPIFNYITMTLARIAYANMLNNKPVLTNTALTNTMATFGSDRDAYITRDERKLPYESASGVKWSSEVTSPKTNMID